MSSFHMIPVVLDNEIFFACCAWSCWGAFWQESPLVVVGVLAFSASRPSWLATARASLARDSPQPSLF